MKPLYTLYKIEVLLQTYTYIVSFTVVHNEDYHFNAFDYCSVINYYRLFYCYSVNEYFSDQNGVTTETNVIANLKNCYTLQINGCAYT